MTWYANEFTSANEKPRYKTKSSESSNVMSMCVRVVSDKGFTAGTWMNIFYEYSSTKASRSGGDTAQG